MQPDPIPDAVKENPAVIEKQIEQVKEGEHKFTAKVPVRGLYRFEPDTGLEVLIDFRRQGDPYELAEEVRYSNSTSEDGVHLRAPKGFQWDGASIPTWTPVVPWVVSLLLIHYWPGWGSIAISAALILYTLRLLPYLQKMGLHARGCCFHDVMYRLQVVSRIVADAIMESIHEHDNVPIDIRKILYAIVRMTGWWAWRKNAAKLVAVQAGEIEPDETDPTSELAPTSPAKQGE